MFHGRMDVYWPDGPVESYRLNKATIAVGRSTGNDIVLDTTAISRYHATFTFKEHQILLEDLDSVNGTYVDGTRLESHTPYAVRGGEEIQMGEIRLIFHPPLEEVTTPTEEDATRRVIFSQPGYQVELEGPDMAVAPGAHVKATLQIENLDTEVDRYQIEVLGLPKGWARTDTNELKLEPGEQGQVMISLKPLRRSESHPGEHELAVRVRSRSRPSETVEAPATLHVLPYSGFGMALGEEHITAAGAFQLFVHNQGNAPLTLTLRGTDAKQALRFQFSQDQLQLSPGERRAVHGDIRPRRPQLFGTNREHEFALLAHAHDASNFLATVPGTYTEKRLLPAWVPVLAAPLLGLAVLLLVATVFWLFGGETESPSGIQPVINAFYVSRPGVPNPEMSNLVIQVGETVVLTWEVLDADTISIVSEQGGNQQRFEAAPGTSSLNVPFNQTGLHMLILDAQNGDLSSVALAAVEVQPSATFEMHAINGPELVRNVQQDISVSWDVKGAQPFDNGYKVWLERADILTPPLLPAPLPPADQQTLTVVVTSDQPEWTVTLYAEGQDGIVINKKQKIAVVYPSCELHAAQTSVRAGPGEEYAIIESLENSPEGNLSFAPLARDPKGTWLQVSLRLNNAQLGWVPLVDFDCANFDPAQLVPSQDFPPLTNPESGSANISGPVPTASVTP